MSNDRANRDAPEQDVKPFNDQLASPALSPIAESVPILPSIEGGLPSQSQIYGRTNGIVASPATRQRSISLVTNGSKRSGSEAASPMSSPMSSSAEPGRILKLSPVQIHELTTSPGSLPLRAANTPTDEIPSLRDTLGSPVNGHARGALFTPPPDAIESTSASGDDGLSVKPATAILSRAAGLSRPSNGPRSVTSPLLRRRESASAPRNPKAANEGSRPRRPSLTPIKVGDELKKDSNGGLKPSPMKEGVASPMPSVIPLPPLSLPTYLQLELSSERPSALYIHRPVSSEFPYESSKVKFERLLNFLRLPHQLEQVLWFGTLACLDAWLYSFTILPLRFLKALWLLIGFWLESLAKEVTELFRYVFAGVRRHWRRKRQDSNVATTMRNDSGSSQTSDARMSRKTLADLDGMAETPRGRRKSSSTSRVRSSRRKPSGLSPYHKADLLHGLLIIISCMLLVRFDASRMYHSIRGQAAIKLYVIYNVLEVCDRLFSALGQDVLECLFSKETLERKPNGRSKVIRPIWMFILALIYNVIHAALLFYQVVTLNVAVNSYSNALLTLLMSNQFVEIKGTVFKKFEKENLFQLTCADVVERFQLWLMLSIIGARNIVEVGGLSFPASYPRPSPSPANATAPNSTATPAPSLLPAAFSLLPSISLSSPVLTPFLIVLGSEMLVDWLKHAYINKFNSVKPSIYGRFLDVLAKDYYAHAFADQNLTKRLGLPTLPLACLVLRAAAQVWGMFVATNFAPTSVGTSLAAAGIKGPEATAALARMDAVFRRAMGRSSGDGWGRVWEWSADDAMAFGTMVLFVLLLYLVLLAFKLVLGMALLGFARGRYRGMKEREREGHDTHSRRVGGWGVTEVDEDKRRWIYEDDPEGLRKLREREARDREKRAAPEGEKGLKLEGVGRYMMAAKRIW
ncbi:Endoplasmic reticulum membrane protein 65 [Sphaceloma murrayae]|uniref:Endoplasmic reticulum membrane protein 65 n=1 Tax=Sphaceloma murrayae TaxID=2082308 RepID=A0A2K1QGE7_9PEZI|nr:Endoplasmic reticulum membrane protein 65 [Sphaceloma murrayae]